MKKVLIAAMLCLALLSHAAGPYFRDRITFCEGIAGLAAESANAKLMGMPLKEFIDAIEGVVVANPQLTPFERSELVLAASEGYFYGTSPQKVFDRCVSTKEAWQT